MFNMNDTQAKAQMENFWKYLDDMSQENPEEYKKFISEQMKKGINQKAEEEKTEETQKQQEILLKPKTFLCLRFKLSKILKEKQAEKKNNEIKIFDSESNLNSSNNSSELLAIPKILFSFEWQSEAFSPKILEEPKVYLSIIHSEGFTGPLDENNQPLKNPENDKDWKYIPTEFRYNNKKNCMSGKRCDFYEMMVCSSVIDAICKSEELKRSILAYFVRKFTIFLNNKYELYVKNVKILKSRKYKSLKSLPDDFAFKPNAKLGSLNLNSGNNQAIDSATAGFGGAEKSSLLPPAKNFFDVPGNKINIPQASENFTNTPSFYNMSGNKDAKSNLAAKKGFNNNNTTNNVNNKAKKDEIAQQPKKILIEEITKKTKKLIEVKKNILDQNQIEVKFILDNFEEIESFNDIDLQVSENGVKLLLDKVPEDEYQPIDMDFNFTVDPDKCVAKYDKKNKILKLILSKN